MKQKRRRDDGENKYQEEFRSTVTIRGIISKAKSHEELFCSVKLGGGEVENRSNRSQQLYGFRLTTR